MDLKCIPPASNPSMAIYEELASYFFASVSSPVEGATLALGFCKCTHVNTHRALKIMIYRYNKLPLNGIY